MNRGGSCLYNFYEENCFEIIIPTHTPQSDSVLWRKKISNFIPLTKREMVPQRLSLLKIMEKFYFLNQWGRQELKHGEVFF